MRLSEFTSLLKTKLIKTRRLGFHNILQTKKHHGIKNITLQRILNWKERRR